MSQTGVETESLVSACFGARSPCHAGTFLEIALLSQRPGEPSSELSWGMLFPGGRVQARSHGHGEEPEQLLPGPGHSGGFCSPEPTGSFPRTQCHELLTCMQEPRVSPWTDVRRGCLEQSPAGCRQVRGRFLCSLLCHLISLSPRPPQPQHPWTMPP